MTSTRIFIGGIPPGTTSEELVQRFKSFGDVTSCDVVPDKKYPSLLPGSEPMVFSRNFGFVTIEPKDEKSLQRAIAVYNGSLWRGCTLRCKLAKPTAMERMAEEQKEEEELADEPVDHTLPQAEEGTKLRIRQPFNRQLVSVVLGGSELKLKKLDDTALHLSTSSSLEDNKNIVSTPLKPRKLFEQHLRECAEKYAASEEGQRAAAARQDRLENTKAAAAEDQETAVNLSLNKDAAVLTLAAANRKAQNNTQAHRQQRSTVLPAKRLLGAAPPPAQRKRTVDFLSDEDFTTIRQLQNTAADLSRFGSDSNSDEEENVKKQGGVGDLSRFDSDSEEEENGGGGGKSIEKIIPQVDGAADSEDTTTTSTPTSDDDSPSSVRDEDSSSSSDDESDEENSDGDAIEKDISDTDSDSKKLAPAKKDSSSSGGSSSGTSTNSTSSESDTSTPDDSSGTSESSDSETDESKNENGSTDGDDGGGLQNKEINAAAWMAEYLPAGASFFRKDPLVQIEGAWRAGREAAVREYKERRRQALRQAGKSSGGGTGGGKRRRE